MSRTHTVTNLDGSITESSAIPLAPGRLERLFRELFTQHWPHIVFGPCIAGAVFELHLSAPPQHIAMLDGYLTVDAGPWHFYLCLDRHTDAPSPEIARQRQTARAAFFQDTHPAGHVPATWGLRLWNGLDEQMITVFFPNPYLSDAMTILHDPDWNRLTLWHTLRQQYTMPLEPLVA